MTPLKDRISIFKDGARRCIEEDGHAFPMFAYMKDSVIEIATAEFSGAGDKDRFADFTVEAIRKRGLREYVTVTEAWILAAPAGVAEEQRRRYGSLEHAPGREEAVIIAHCTPTSETMYFAKIDRSGGTPTLGDWEATERRIAALGIADRGCRFMGLFARAAGDN